MRAPGAAVLLLLLAAARRGVAAACDKCPFQPGAVCCDPTTSPPQACPGGAACCDCGTNACDCAASPPTPAPAPPPATPAPAPTPAPPPPPPGSGTQFYAEGRNLMLRVGSAAPTRFFVKGFAYGNIPVGSNPDNATSMPPDGRPPNCPTDYEANQCWDSLATPPSPGAELACVKDIAKMRATNANALRGYNAAGFNDHTTCLDAAWNGGNRPVYVILVPWIDLSKWTASGPTPQFEADMTALVRKTMDHPATMGWSFGAEGTPYSLGDSLFTTMNQFIAKLRPMLGSRKKIFTFAPVDWDPWVKNADAAGLDLDVWGFDKYVNQLQPTLDMLSALKHPKPAIFMEYGFPRSTRATDPDGGAWPGCCVPPIGQPTGSCQKASADTCCAGAATELPAASAAQKIKDAFDPVTPQLRANFDGASPLVSGGMVFEFCDEWWKAGRQFEHNGGSFGGVITPYVGGWPGGCHDEEYFGAYMVDGQDKRHSTALSDYLKAEWAKY